MAFDDPFFAVGTVWGKFGPHHHTSVNKRQGTADAYNAAPGSQTDSLPYLQFLKLVREKVTVGCGIVVDKYALRTNLHFEAPGDRLGVPRHGHHGHFTVQALDDHG